VKILRDITAKSSEDEIKKMQRARRTKCPQGKCTRFLSHDLKKLANYSGCSIFRNNFDTLQPALAKELLKFHIAAVNELNMLDYLVEWAG
jgi:two-component system CheB/CheR fusion protein